MPTFPTATALRTSTILEGHPGDFSLSPALAATPPVHIVTTMRYSAEYLPFPVTLSSKVYKIVWNPVFAHNQGFGSQVIVVFSKFFRKTSQNLVHFGILWV
jgi:hypothetical protein